MVKLEKVKISKMEEEYSTNYCRHCDKYYCSECVDFYEVDFDVDVNIYEGRPDLKPEMENWKGERVCPWCYNQLIEKKEAK